MVRPRFKLGDRVRVREDSFFAFRGLIVTISGIKKHCDTFEYSIREDPQHRYLSEFEFENTVYKDWYGDDCRVTYALNKPTSVNLNIGGIKKVIYNNPATIILWEDGTKTVVKVQDGDVYSKELGFAMCVSKKYFGNQSNFNNVFKKYVYGTEQE